MDAGVFGEGLKSLSSRRTLGKNPDTIVIFTKILMEFLLLDPHKKHEKKD